MKNKTIFCENIIIRESYTSQRMLREMKEKSELETRMLNGRRKEKPENFEVKRMWEVAEKAKNLNERKPK